MRIRDVFKAAPNFPEGPKRTWPKAIRKAYESSLIKSETKWRKRMWRLVQSDR